MVLVLILMIITLLIMLVGVFTMLSSSKSKKYGGSLMSLRILFQLLTILALGILCF